MTKRMAIVAMTAVVAYSLSLLAGSCLSGSWSSEILFEPLPGFIKSLDSVLTLNYAFGSLASTSESEFFLLGFIWQGFGLTGKISVLDVQADLLFGPSTADFLYAQEIISTSIAGVDLSFYGAYLSDAVLGGPADGFAYRVAGSAGGLDIVSITEFGARIKDDDFDGITIWHAATGLHKTYDTNPIVPGQGFTGEKLTVSGWQLSCIEDIATTMYFTCCQSPSRIGFEWVKFDLTGIDIGLSPITLDAELIFKVQTKSLSLIPQLNVGRNVCLQVYAELLTDAPAGRHTTNRLFGPYTSLTGISVYGLEFICRCNNVTVRELAVLDTGHYVITTPEFGSVIEDAIEAIDAGHEFYPDYWELLSVEVVGDGCCGGSYRFLANTYFDRTANNLFGWGMSHIEGKFPINPQLLLSTALAVDTFGFDHFGFGVEFNW